MGDVEQWDADMDAWGLVGPGRTYHLMRLHQHHLRVMRHHERKAERLDRMRLWFTLALVVTAAATVVIGAL